MAQYVIKEQTAEQTRLREEFGLTRRQAAYVEIKTQGEANSDTDAAKRAGYSSSRMMSKVKESSRVQNALKSEIEQRLKIERLREEYKRDPKNYVEGKLLQHSEDEKITPNQTRAVELLGKMNGAFIERIEIDAGEFLRSQLGKRILSDDFLLE